MPIKYFPSAYGTRAVVNCEVTPEVLAELKNNKVTVLALGSMDLSFLESYPELLGLHLVGVVPEHCNINFDKIHCLSNLKYLRIEGSYLKDEIRFEAFPDLEEASVDWRQKAKSVFHSVKLKILVIDHYKGKDLSAFSHLTNLEELSLLNSPLESLNGIEKLTKLKKIRFGNLRKLTTVSELASLTNLEELWIEGSRKIQSIDAVANLINLKVLNFSDSGDIETIKPIAKLNKLERIIFSGSTNIVDGDLTPLLNRPNIVIALPRRKHYFPI
jgi:Leucine-rich repeat (LRR) protein